MGRRKQILDSANAQKQRQHRAEQERLRDQKEKRLMNQLRDLLPSAMTTGRVTDLAAVREARQYIIQLTKMIGLEHPDDSGKEESDDEIEDITPPSKQIQQQPLYPVKQFQNAVAEPFPMSKNVADKPVMDVLAIACAEINESMDSGFGSGLDSSPERALPSPQNVLRPVTVQNKVPVTPIAATVQPKNFTANANLASSVYSNPNHPPAQIPAKIQTQNVPNTKSNQVVTARKVNIIYSKDILVDQADFSNKAFMAEFDQYLMPTIVQPKPAVENRAPSSHIVPAVGKTSSVATMQYGHNYQNLINYRGYHTVPQGFNPNISTSRTNQASMASNFPRMLSPRAVDHAWTNVQNQAVRR